MVNALAAEFGTSAVLRHLAQTPISRNDSGALYAPYCRTWGRLHPLLLERW
jgi:hypothetical protein